MLLIPAIEFDEKVVTGTRTISSEVISSIADTSLISIGQIVYGAGVPYGSRVVSKTSNSVTLSNAATASGTSLLSFFTRFEFRYPASTDEGEQIKADQSVTRSLTGITQTLTNYIDAERNLTFGFITKAEKDFLIDDFFIGWALFGKSFRYFDDKEINSIKTYENASETANIVRQVKKHPDFLYEIEFNFRRVI
jgi:hypothetical protein